MIAELVSGVILDAINMLGYGGILFLMALESAALPVPSEVVMPFAGYLAFQGRFDMPVVIAMGTIGNLVGSLLAYYVGLLGGRPMLERYGKHILFDGNHLVMAERWFEKYGDKAVFFSRMMPVVRTFISLPAGVGKMNVGKFALLTVVGSLPWVALLTYVGFLLGPNWTDIIGFFNGLDLLIVAGFAAFVAWHFIRRGRNAKRGSWG